MTNTITFRCCEAFERAKQMGTDTEYYGPVVEVFTREGGDPLEGIVIGRGLPLINFCPWCGVKVEHAWVDSDGKQPMTATEVEERRTAAFSAPTMAGDAVNSGASATFDESGTSGGVTLITGGALR